MVKNGKAQKTIVIGAGPVGALAALYAAQRGHEVEIYELRSGTLAFFLHLSCASFNALEYSWLSPKHD
jgi:2-polyprenyl-6-methoxyphenol hydroxylase-like FAD-dependent oxidoreductase